MTTISIAMATYNGARYLPEQLASFSAQTRLPDELVICDDGSTDETVAVIEQFSRDAPFAVRLFRNDTNLGFVRNFEKALTLCNGELIFLSDQDDVWFADKLQTVEAIFEAHPAIQVVINDQEITDAELNPSGVTKLGNVRKAGSNDDLFKTGCCSAMRHEWRDYVLPIPPSAPAHDIWINRPANLLGARYVISEALQYYRRHGDNASNWILSQPRIPSQMRTDLGNVFGECASAWSKTLVQLTDLRQHLGNRTPPCSVSEAQLRTAIERVDQEISLKQQRLKLIAKHRLRRLPTIAHLFFSGAYATAKGWRSAVRDVLAPRAAPQG